MTTAGTRGNARGEPAGATQTATTPEIDERAKLGGADHVPDPCNHFHGQRDDEATED